ncbi:MAG: SusC/RagA family TonB-linked outer membrane protein, partial [Bacteroidales bacterium]|nr:SusC/RagA family TonB-linked outer membrane protein [Bacteroidales bacterium]
GFSRTASANASEFPVPSIRRVELTSNTATQTGSGGFGADNRQQSFFGRILYSYADRYSLTATIRRDGSSNFGAGNVYGTFPSLAAAWRISEEEFMKDQNIFSNLKLRAGWGQTGNAGNTTNLSVDQVSSNRIAFYFYNPVTQTFTTGGGLAQVNEIDTNLQWETNEQINIGIDMGFIANALSLTVDYFRRDAKELLLYKGLRPSTGFTQIYTNAGHIRNSGFEFQLGYQKRWGDWNLGLKANGTIVKNEAVDVGPDIYASNGVAAGSWWSNYSLTRNGNPVGSYFGWRADGIFQSQSEIDALNASAIAAGGTAYQASAKPGDRKFKDLDGNGWVSDADREILGNGYPDLTYGLNLTLGWKNFDFNLYLYGVTGQDILSYSYRNLISMMDPTGSGLQNVLADYAVNAYTDTHKSDIYPRVTKADPNHNGQVSDAFIRNGDFLKIQNLQVGYTLPKQLLSSLRMESARVFVSVENLLTISKYDVGDPEVGSNNVMQTGFDGGRYPFPRVYTFGINFGF